MKFNLKNKSKFYITLGIVVAILLIWAFVSAAIITKTFQRNVRENKLDNKKVSVEDLLITETKDGKKYWEIFADKGYYEDAQKIAYVTNSIGNFYEEDEVVASFESPRATINSETGSIIMYDRSKLMYKDYTSIIADEFTYEGTDKPIYAKGNVIIENPGQFYLTGNNAVLSNEMTNIKIDGKVTTKIYDKGNIKWKNYYR